MSNRFISVAIGGLIWAISIGVLLSCTHAKVKPPALPPIPTLEIRLAEEGTVCTDINAHAEGDAPDCRLMLEAWQRGRERLRPIYGPRVDSVKMGQFYFYRPARTFGLKEYPLIKSGLDNPNDPYYYIRGLYDPGLYLVVYSYEYVLEHEATHAIGFVLDGGRPRSATAIAMTPNPQIGVIPTFVYQIYCHGTLDDPVGEPGNIAGCLKDWKEYPR